MPEEENPIRRAQRLVRDNARSLRNKFEESGITSQVSQVASAAGQSISKTYRESGLSEAMAPVREASSDAIKYTAEKAVKV
ncbi:MAG: hypothetical protein V7742_22610, partial [Halioglobus sp.]